MLQSLISYLERIFLKVFVEITLHCIEAFLNGVNLQSVHNSFAAHDQKIAKTFSDC